MDTTDLTTLHQNISSLYQATNDYSEVLKNGYYNNSFYQNAVNTFSDNHPLSDYSQELLSLMDSAFSDWRSNQQPNFDRAKQYVDRVAMASKSRHGTTDVGQLVNDKVEQFDIPLINIQLSFNSLLQCITNIHINASQKLHQSIPPTPTPSTPLVKPSSSSSQIGFNKPSPMLPTRQPQLPQQLSQPAPPINRKSLPPNQVGLQQPLRPQSQAPQLTSRAPPPTLNNSIVRPNDPNATTTKGDLKKKDGPGCWSLKKPGQGDDLSNKPSVPQLNNDISRPPPPRPAPSAPTTSNATPPPRPPPSVNRLSNQFSQQQIQDNNGGDAPAPPPPTRQRSYTQGNVGGSSSSSSSSSPFQLPPSPPSRTTPPPSTNDSSPPQPQPLSSMSRPRPLSSQFSQPPVQQQQQPLQPRPQPLQQQQQQNNNNIPIRNNNNSVIRPNMTLKSSSTALPTYVSLQELQNNLEKHRQLWDNRKWKIVRKYEKSVRMIAEEVKTIEPGNLMFKLTMSVPATTMIQTVRSSSYELVDVNSNLLSTAKIIETGSGHQVYRIEYQLSPSITHVKAVYTTEVDNYSLDMVEDTQNDQSYVPESLDPQSLEYTNTLESRDPVIFDTPEFKQFIDREQLNRKQLQDGSYESDLCFMYRVSLWIYANIQYDASFNGAKPLETVARGRGDCGSHTNLFAAIARYHGIPARTVVCRSNTNKSTAWGTYHVKNQFYLSGIGWIPYDGAYKDGNPFHKRAFGKDSCDWMILHNNYIYGYEDLHDQKSSFFCQLAWTIFGGNGTWKDYKSTPSHRIEPIDPPPNTSSPTPSRFLSTPTPSTTISKPFSSQPLKPNVINNQNNNNNGGGGGGGTKIKISPFGGISGNILRNVVSNSNNNNTNSNNNSSSGNSLSKYKTNLPQYISLDELRNNLEKQRQLWDNKRWKIIRKYVKSCRITMEYGRSFASGQVGKWTFYMPVPTSSMIQTVRAASYDLVDEHSNIIGSSEVVEAIESKHQVYKATYEPRVNEKAASAISSIYTIEVDCYELEIQEITDANDHSYVPEQLDPQERENSLQSQGKVIFDTAEFNEFINNEKLYRMTLQDGTQESDHCLMYRVSLWVFANITYESGCGGQTPLETYKNKKGDCGSHSNLFAAIGRYHSIPTRILVCRSNSNQQTDWATLHIKTQFYLPSIGWVPYDGAYKDRGAFHKKAFGNEESKWIAFHHNPIRGHAGKSNQQGISYQSCSFEYSYSSSQGGSRPTDVSNSVSHHIEDITGPI